MRITESDLKGVYIIEIEPLTDERGFFARSWCADEIRNHELNPKLVQCNISFNNKRGTLRGMHYQVAPFAEAKLVRCTKGAIFDVVVDLRTDSVSFKKWFSIELNDENRRALYIPESFAHGFQTLEDSSEVFYQMSESFHPECARGFRWDAPEIDIQWPITDIIISKKDEGFPRYLRL